MTIDINWPLILRYALGVALVAFVVIRTLWPAIMQLAGILYARLWYSESEPVAESSDMSAPAGYKEHAAKIRDAVAANCPDDVLCTYLLGGYTVAQVLAYEVARLTEA